MVRILGNSRPRRHDGGTSDGLRASLVKEVYLEVTPHSNLIFESDFVGATIIEVSEDLHKVDIPIRNRRRGARRKEDGANSEGFEDRGGHRDDSVEVMNNR